MKDAKINGLITLDLVLGKQTLYKLVCFYSQQDTCLYTSIVLHYVNRLLLQTFFVHV